MDRQTSARVMLGVGYLLAVPPLLRFNAIVRSRNALVYFGALELGTGLIVTGWIRRGRVTAVVPNLAALVGFPLYWVWTGRRARRG